MKEGNQPFNAQKALRVACLVLADLILINLSAFLALYISCCIPLYTQLYKPALGADLPPSIEEVVLECSSENTVGWSPANKRHE